MENLTIKKFTLSRDDSIMEGWPDLIRLVSGKLLIIYNQCVSHGNRDHSQIAMRTSDDNGNTWSEKSYIDEETFNGDNWNSIRVNQLSDGRIILLCDRVIDKETSAETGLYMWESTDDGKTWSEKRHLNIFGYCSDKVRELSDGSLLICISVYNPETEKTEIMAHRSTDGGKTWSGRIPVAQSEAYTFIEPAAMELSDGTVAVFIRENSMKGYNGFISYSYDKGCSFKDLQEIPVKGMHRPFIGKLNDGNIFLSYREHVAPKYPDLKACVFSEEELDKKESFRTFSIDHDNSETPDQGYSTWVQLPDGSLLMANYIVDDAPKAYIRGYKINF